MASSFSLGSMIPIGMKSAGGRPWYQQMALVPSRCPLFHTTILRSSGSATAGIELPIQGVNPTRAVVLPPSPRERRRMRTAPNRPSARGTAKTSPERNDCSLLHDVKIVDFDSDLVAD